MKHLGPVGDIYPTWLKRLRGLVEHNSEQRPLSDESTKQVLNSIILEGRRDIMRFTRGTYRDMSYRYPGCAIPLSRTTRRKKERTRLLFSGPFPFLLIC